MSALFSPDSKFLQRFLSSGGFYKGDIDGDVGSGTKAALGDFETQTEQVANDVGPFDKTTEGKIGTMLIPTQRKAREFMKNIWAGREGLVCIIETRLMNGTNFRER
jgi:peptidoglycan L-alanyl-D-glutamate endopeptidase CwlK